MEAAGIEPASENVPQRVYILVRLRFVSYPDLKQPASWPGHKPVEFRLSPPGQQFEAILQKVTPFN